MTSDLGKRLNNALARLMLAPGEVGAVDPSRDRISTGKGGHHPHRGASKPTGNAIHPAQRWTRIVERIVERIEAEAGGHYLPSAPGRRVALSQAELEFYEGVRAEEVAFLEGCSIDSVRRKRREDRREMATGYRLEAPRPLTAPAKHTLSTLEEQ